MLKRPKKPFFSSGFFREEDENKKRKRIREGG